MKSSPDLNHRANTASFATIYASHVTSMSDLSLLVAATDFTIAFVSLGPSCRTGIEAKFHSKGAGVTAPLKTTQILSLILNTVLNRRYIAAGKIEISSPDASRDGH